MARSPTATPKAARASSRVESSVGTGETSGVTRSGISVQTSATASQPRPASSAMTRTYAAREPAVKTPFTSSSKMILFRRARPALDELEGCTDAVRRWQLDTAWHATLTSAGGNRHLAGLIAQLRTSLSRYELAYMRQVQSRENADQQHREILSALEAGDARRAASLLTEHWHDGAEVILRWLTDSADS